MFARRCGAGAKPSRLHVRGALAMMLLKSPLRYNMLVTQPAALALSCSVVVSNLNATAASWHTPTVLIWLIFSSANGAGCVKAPGLDPSLTFPRSILL